MKHFNSLKKTKNIWISIFFLVLSVPNLLYPIIGQHIDKKNYENRNSFEKPLLSVHTLQTYPDEYESYYNDNLPFRNQFIRINNYIDYYCFKKSSSKSVVIAENNWLFYCNKENNDPLSQSLGCWKFTNEELSTIASNLTSVNDVLKNKGIEFVLFIAPNKETIYMDKLPNYYNVIDSQSSTDQLVNYLQENTNIRIVYPKKQLLSMRKTDASIITYQPLDTHWNSAGGYVGAVELSSELSVPLPSIHDVTLKETFSDSGDLANLLNLKFKDSNINYEISNFSDNTLTNLEDDFFGSITCVSSGTSVDNRRLLIRRDSYCTAMYPFICSQFTYSKLIHKDSFNSQYIISEKANIFVYETVERHIQDLLSFNLNDI